jgi:hypothetical protein
MRRLLLAATVTVLLTVAAAADAATPIMPLSEVQPGMRCTGYTVVKGTQISSFDVEVVDVVQGDPVSAEPLLLIRVSGPVVAASGIAEGYSGSPVVCDGRIAAAIAYGSGDYGNLLGYATPIQELLGEPVPTPTGARVDPALRHAVALRTPIAVSGVSGPVFAPFAKAAAQAGISLVAVPAAPVGDRFPVQTLVPGSSMAVGLSSGAVSSGAVGTVSYVDGDKVYGFGHPFSGTGVRSLLLQDAYVYDVVANPLDTQESVSTKIAAPGHDLGALTYDGRDGVAGVLGTLPPTVPVTQRTTNLDTGVTRTDTATVADETDVGLPDGVSPMATIAPLLNAQAAYTALDGSPVLQSATMCVRITMRELPKPTGFCNRYVGGYGGSGSNGGPFTSDLITALGDVDAFSYGTPHLTGVSVHLAVRTGLDQALLRSISGPRVLHRGERATLRLHLQAYRGARFTRDVPVTVPRAARLGRRTLRVAGTGLDGQVRTDELQIVIGDDDGADDGGDSGPKSFAALADQIAGTHGYDGTHVSFGKGAARRLYRDPLYRISGSAKIAVRVAR